MDLAQRAILLVSDGSHVYTVGKVRSWMRKDQETEESTQEFEELGEKEKCGVLLLLFRTC